MADSRIVIPENQIDVTLEDDSTVINIDLTNESGQYFAERAAASADSASSSATSASSSATSAQSSATSAQSSATTASDAAARAEEAASRYVVDQTIIQRSPNAVAGGAVYDALQNVQTDLNIENGAGSFSLVGNAVSGSSASVTGGRSTSFNGENTVSGNQSLAEGSGNSITGVMSHAEGYGNSVGGGTSHGEGTNNAITTGNNHHIEGYNNTIAGGNYSHVEGNDNSAGSSTNTMHIEGTGNNAALENNIMSDTHIEGYDNSVKNSNRSHIEGTGGVIDGANTSHVEGLDNTVSTANAAHIEGTGHTVSGATNGSHIEGYDNTATSLYSYGVHIEGTDNEVESNGGYIGTHLEGYSNTVKQGGSGHVEGHGNTVGTQNSHIEGDTNTLESGANENHVEGTLNTLSSGATYNHVEGASNTATNGSSRNHIEGEGNTATTNLATTHIEGVGNTVHNATKSHVEGTGNRYGTADETSANSSSAVHLEGCANVIAYKSSNSHVEGTQNTIQNNTENAHAEGVGNTIENLSTSSHAEGTSNTVRGASTSVHVEGNNNTIQGGSINGHAEGGSNQIKDGSFNAHVEGYSNTIQDGGSYGHAEGNGNLIRHGSTGAHIEGLGNKTPSVQQYIHVQGKYNDAFDGQTVASNTYAEIVGGGNADNDRKNIRELKWTGDEKLAGKLTLGADGTDSADAVRKGQMDTALAGKQNTLTFDSTPTAGSTNPVTSDGIASVVSTLNNNLSQKVSSVNSETPDTNGNVEISASDIPANGMGTKETSGNPIEIEDGVAGNVLGLSVDLEPIQDLHGYDHPWVGGAGKNKFDKSQLVTNGDASFTVSGETITVTGKNPYAKIYIPETSLPQTSGSYVLSLNIDSVQNITRPFFGFSIRKSDSTHRYVGNTSKNTGAKIVKLVLEPGEYMERIDLNINDVNTESENLITAVLSNIQLEYSSEATTFEPYSNICPITGRTQVEITNKDSEDVEQASVTVQLGQTVYGGTLNVSTGELVVRTANIASYNGETIGEPWWSSMDEYVAGTTPTTGAQVVYTLANPVTSTLTPAQFQLLEGYNLLTTDGDTLNLRYIGTEASNVQAEIDEFENVTYKLTTSIAPIEQTTAIATHAVGDYIMLNGQFCKVISAIAVGEAITIGTNVSRTTIADELKAIIAQLGA